MYKTTISRIIVGFIVITLMGCSWFKPYHVDVQQGNIIDQKELKNIKIGMSRSEIQDLLGDSVLANGFNKDCLNYAYTNQINGCKIEKKIIELCFEKNSLVKISSKKIT